MTSRVRRGSLRTGGLGREDQRGTRSEFNSSQRRREGISDSSDPRVAEESSVETNTCAATKLIRLVRGSIALPRSSVD